MCKYTTIFCIVDDFCKLYQDYLNHKLLEGNKKRNREGKLSLSETISIMIFYHFSPFKNFKTYYHYAMIGGNMFSNPPCYDRFIQIIPNLFLPMVIMPHYLIANTEELYCMLA